MTNSSDIFRQSMEQMTALTRNWTQMPGFDPAMLSEANTQKLASLGTDLQALYGEAYQRHLDRFLTGNQRIAEQFTSLGRSRNPRDLADFQLELMRLVMEGMSIRAEIWGELADKVAHRYAEFMRAMVADMKFPSEQAAPEHATTRGKPGAVAKAAAGKAAG